ncbi:HEAT repeat domain-containing protein [Gracilinema caldarium]|uniref:HEAT domain containing protein n=1 Tax=Gracilinema caldarium (strain ATCC 51460 / DSM 7334 / H1) TaxID=744872 RepID=F8F3D3_GRAC1|nr:HEAT repeat domain-containing protein [Gracilinema caldarium]AEJ19509.1 HEAT domain containing protein [Gracilinema caldarium DSM 7334]
MRQKLYFFISIFILFFPRLFMFAQETSIIDKQRDIIRYGTETEIANLIATLRKDNATYLNDELITIANITKNVKILTGVFSFFTEQNKSGLEQKAIEIIQNRYDEQKETVRSAIEYVGAIKAQAALKSLQDILNTEDKSFINSAIRSIGKIASSSSAHQKKDIADFLINFYKTKELSDDDKNAIIYALGETGVSETIDFIADIATNPDERPFRKMTALEALGKIRDEKGLNAIIQGAQDSDPNVRASAISSLGSFSDKKVEPLILEAFRDSFYKTRLAAAKAAEERALASAIPYLKFRAANDEVAAVKEASVKALGKIANNEAIAALVELFSKKNSPDTIKIMAAQMLMSIDATKYGPDIIKSYQEAKQQKQKTLQAGLAKVLGEGKSSNLKNLAQELLRSTDVVELSYGLQLVKNNQFTDLEELIRPLLDEKKYGSLAIKAKETLEAMNLK